MPGAERLPPPDHRCISCRSFARFGPKPAERKRPAPASTVNGRCAIRNDRVNGGFYCDKFQRAKVAPEYYRDEHGHRQCDCIECRPEVQSDLFGGDNGT